MWTLVFIYLYAGEAYAVKYDTYDNMVTCFQAREALADEVGKGAGYFKPGQQAICISEEQDSV